MKEINKLSFKTMLITIGELPTAYIESMSYYEGLCYLVNYLCNSNTIIFYCKDDYLCNNVIPALNNNGQAVEELQEKYKELVTYVDTYFDNLDVQEEINNKLDEMAEQGDLAQIILDYLQMNGLLMFDTKADLKAAENLIEGSTCETLGNLLYNDGHTELYKIRALDPSDVIDDYELVALTNYTTAENDIVNINDDITDIEGNIGDLDNLDTTDKSSIVNAINESLDYADTKMSSYSNYKDQFYYYVDGTDGDDDNDGLTSATAFKTLDKFFSLLNTSSSDIRCHIQTAGTYKLSHAQVINSNIHIIGESGSRDDIIITTDEAEMVFYGGHINFKNITWDMPYNYFDNVLISLDNCKILQNLRAYGGGVEIKNSSINQVRLSWSKGVFQNIIIDDQDKTNNAIHLDSCSELTCFDNLTISALSNNSSYGVIGCWRGTLHLVGTIINNTNSGDYYNGIVGNHMIIDSTTTVINAFDSLGAHNNDLGHALVFTNSQNLPV